MKNNNRKIKTSLAALTVTPDGSFLIAVRHNNQSRCLRFTSPGQLKDAIKAKKIVVKKWIVAVPRSLCIIRRLSMPTDNLEEAVRMAEFELPTLVPIPPDELVYGCLPLARQDNMLDVMVCILQMTRLQLFLEPLSEIGIEPHRIVLSSMAFCHLSQTAGEPMNNSANIVAIIDHTFAEVITYKNDILFQTDTISLPKDDSCRSYIHISREIRRQLEQIPPDNGENISILLAGLENSIPTLKQQISSAIDCNRINTIRVPDITDYGTAIESESQMGRYGFYALLAQGLVNLSLRSCWQSFNLLPRDMLKKLDHRLLRRKGVLAGGLASLFVILLWLCMWGINWRQQQLCRQIEARIAPLAKAAGQVEGKQQKIKAILGQLSNRQQIDQLIDDLFRLTPRHITLSDLSYTSKDTGDSIRLKGQADTLANAFGYTQAMRKARRLNAIQIENAQQVARPGGSIVEFKGHCLVKNE